MEDSASSLFDFPTLLSAMGCSLPEEALSYTPTINETYCRTILHALSQTEPVDEAWTKRLSSLSGSFTSTLKKAHAYLSEAPLPELTAVYQYISYRALEKEPLYGIDAVMTYARQSTDFIFMETAIFGDLPEIIRYADKQMDTLWPEYTRLLNPDLMEINLSDKLQTLKSELIRRELGE